MEEKYMENKYNEIIRVLKREVQKLEEIINDIQCEFLRCEDNNIIISYDRKQNLKKLMKKDITYLELLIYTVKKRNKLVEKRSNIHHEKKKYTITRYTTRY